MDPLTASVLIGGFAGILVGVVALLAIHYFID